MLSGKLLPAHPKPLPNEILSSWFSRIAKDNVVKQHTLACHHMGLLKPPWLWTLDLVGGDKFIHSLCDLTGTPYTLGEKTTLSDYLEKVCPTCQSKAKPLWVLPSSSLGSRFMTDGIQFCPACLSEGTQPYFRRQWRLAFFTFCPIHMNMLYEVCPSCDAPIAYHRRDFSIDLEKAKAITNCYNCNVDFRSSPRLPVKSQEPQILEYYRDLLMEFQTNRIARFDQPFFIVLHQLCMVLTSLRNKDMLRKHIYSLTDIRPISVTHRRTPFYWRSLTTRSHIICLALWLMLDPIERITTAWECGAVHYASLIRDHFGVPSWYTSLTNKMNRQRKTTV